MTLGIETFRAEPLEIGRAPSLLEVNANGQFGWLDDPPGWPLHRAVLEAALDASSSVRGDETVREI